MRSSFGVTTGDVQFDYAVAGRRRDQVVSQLHKGVQFLLRKNKVSVVSGRGRLDGAGRLAVIATGGEEVTLDAGSVIIATGSRPKQLPGIPADGSVVLTSDEALRMNRVPASAIVLGAGAVGVEFASLYRSCGAEVTIVEMLPSLVPLEDAAVGVELRRQFEARGITCLPGHRLDLGSVERNEGGVAVTVADADGNEQRLQAEILLVAVGRAANVEDIGIEGTGSPSTTVSSPSMRCSGPASPGSARWATSSAGFSLRTRRCTRECSRSRRSPGATPTRSIPVSSPAPPTAARRSAPWGSANPRPRRRDARWRSG